MCGGSRKITGPDPAERAARQEAGGDEPEELD
jgi:hypothetical protein